MSRYLIKTTEVYRVNSEDESAKLIAEAKQDQRFQVIKSSTDYKAVKAKGEIVDEFWLTTITKQFTDPKEPDCTVSVKYDYEAGAFPEPIVREDDEDDEEEDGGLF